MSDAAITIRGLGKRYRLGERERYRALRDSVPRALRASFRRLRSAIDGGPAATDGAETHIWALRDVSLSVREGEVVGIIGRNGAGKSTLLKVLSRITEPTEGRAVVRGRVGSLLEIGTGFHPELTGRENIYLNGAILGMRKREIDARFDEIVAFAEVEAFLDSPVKRYSSGMQMRLAFAVAAHLEPEILLVDEVLAVGDAQFQKKCLGKMGAVATTGRTVLLVSHNMAAIQSLCGRVLWLDQGHVRHEGSAARVVSTYLQNSFSPTSERRWVDSSTAPGNEHVRLRRARVRPAEGSPSAPVTTETPLLLEFEYWNLRPGAHLNLSLQVYTEDGVMAFNTAPAPGMGFYPEALPAGLFRDTCRIPGNFLNDGIHRVELLVVRDDTIVQLRIEDLLVFDVHDTVQMRGSWYDKWQGAVRPTLQWTSERLDSDPVETLAASVRSC